MSPHTHWMGLMLHVVVSQQVADEVWHQAVLLYHSFSLCAYIEEEYSAPNNASYLRKDKIKCRKKDNGHLSNRICNYNFNLEINVIIWTNIQIMCLFISSTCHTWKFKVISNHAFQGHINFHSACLICHIFTTLSNHC